MTDPFLFKVADVVVDEMAPVYPELSEHRMFIASVVKAEEEKFIETLDKGLVLLSEEVASTKKRAAASSPARWPSSSMIPSGSRLI